MRPKIQPVFIVGAGRYGSTMLSNMVRSHCAILSVSDLVSVADLGGRIPYRIHFQPPPSAL